MDEFVKAAIDADYRAASHDVRDDLQETVHKFFAFLKRQISGGEIKDVAVELPGKIKEFMVND